MQEGMTIVIPVRNRAKLIERTLNSVIAGVQLPCALIIVDNGSDDETFEVCRLWQAAHSTLDMTISVVQEDEYIDGVSGFQILARDSDAVV